jgi:hypothetical protein
MPPRVLCVAEKPSIAKDLAAMLSGGQVSSLRESRRPSLQTARASGTGRPPLYSAAPTVPARLIGLLTQYCGRRVANRPLRDISASLSFPTLYMGSSANSS